MVRRLAVKIDNRIILLAKVIFSKPKILRYGSFDGKFENKLPKTSHTFISVLRNNSGLPKRIFHNSSEVF